MNRARRSLIQAVRTSARRSLIQAVRTSARRSLIPGVRTAARTPLVRRGSLLAFVALVLSALSSAGEGPLDFLPTPSGNVGAFLVAGPFEKPQGAVERMEPAREGAELPGGTSWRVALTADGNGIVVGGAGPHHPDARPAGAGPHGLDARPAGAGGRGGVYYARTEFPEAAGGRRAVSVVASCRVTAWAAPCGETGRADPATAEIVTAPAYARKKLEVDAAAGPTVLLLRLEPAGTRAGFAVRAGILLPSGRVLPEGGRLCLADASVERVGELVRRSLSLRVTPKLASERTPVLVEFTRAGSPPDLPGEVEIELASHDEHLEPFRGEPKRRLELRELGREHVTANFMVNPGAPGLFTIEARVSREGKLLATLAEAGFVSEGLHDVADSFEERGRGLADTFPTVGAFARLQADKIRLSLERHAGPADPALLAEDVGLAERGLREAREGRDFQKGSTGFHERAYVSAIDDSAQPYLVYVPTYYHPDERWPLVVYLHGYVPSYDKHDWLDDDPQMNAVMEAEGCILVIPFGRSNTDFLNAGEDDVLDVIEEMKRHYSIDPRRIYLYGYSMGGSGVWTMITHFPDRFAAAVVLAGRTDYFLWHGIKREEMPPWRRFIIETDNPIDYVENIVHVPVRIYHGAADWVIKREHSKRMADALRAAGGTCELYWIPRGTHWTMFDTVLWTRKPVAWMKEHALPERPPEEFKITARHPRYAAAWHVEVSLFKEWMRPVEFQVTRRTTRILVDSANVRGLWATIRPGESIRQSDPEAYLATTVQDEPKQIAVGWGNVPPEFFVGDDFDLNPRLKCGNVGPIKDAFRSPFCIVYGTTGGEHEQRGAKANAERFRREWHDFAKGWAPIFADTAVADDLMRKKNLILFGEPETNRILADFADSLPIRWDRSEATMAGRTYPMRRRGLAFVYPNPEHPQRAVVVFSGIPWGAHLPPNHKWDLMPDFILYGEDADMLDPMEKTNEWVTAGFFGTDWSLERGRIFVKGVGEVNARGEPVRPEPGAEPVPPAPPPHLFEEVPEAPPGFSPVR